MSEIPKSQPQSNYLDLTPVILLNESILIPDEKNEILKNSCENRKKLLEKYLIEGVNIKNEQEFNSLTKLLKDNLNIDLSEIKFNEINSSFGFAIKKLNENLTVFSLYSFTDLGKNGPFEKIGTIENGKYKKYGFFNGAAYFGETYFTAKGKNLIPKDLLECKAEKKLEQEEKKSEKSAPKLEKPTETHTSYIIKKGDSLWKIVKEQYGLGNTPEDNRDIANIIEELKKNYENKEVIKDQDGKIFVGDILHLPKTIQPIRKGGEKKEFKLK